MFRNVLFLVIVVIVGLIALRWTRRPKRLFEIRVSESDVTILGPVPNKSQNDVREYVRNLRLPVGSRVIGMPDGPDYRLVFSKTIRLDDRDRLDNFMREG